MDLPAKLEAKAKEFDRRRWAGTQPYGYDYESAGVADLLIEAAKRIRALEHEVRLPR